MDPIQSAAHKRVLALVARGQADQDTLAARLSPKEHSASGEQYAWSAKDNVAHNNFWRQDVIWRLQAALDGSTPLDTEAEVQSNNDRVFLVRRETPWEDLVAETERLRAETTALVRRLSGEDLAQRNRYPWQRGESLETLILVNWYDHPAEHWTEVYLSRHEIDHAVELRQAVANTIGELFGRDSKMYSYPVYKLGSLQARIGRSEQAVATIREALTVNPSLIESVRKDADLNPLRVLPAFNALSER